MDFRGQTRGAPADTFELVRKAMILDVSAILLFVLVGGSNHGQSTSVGSVVATAAPFLIALGIAWLLTRAWSNPTAMRTAILIWAITTVLGQILRRSVFDRGTAASFVIVTAAVFGVLLVGWRLVYKLIQARFVNRQTNSTDLPL